MSEGIMIAIVSAVLTGVFNLIGKRMELARQHHSVSAPVSMPPATVNSTLDAAQPSAGSANLGTALRHIGVLQLCLQVIGFLVGAAMGLGGADFASILVVVLIIGSIALLIGFWISGSLVSRTIRWTHLVYVAAGTLITTLIVNSLVLQEPLTGAALTLGLVQTFGTMIVAGVLLNTLKRD